MSSGATDKSLLVEGQNAGWFKGGVRPFAEPGLTPNYGPDRAFEMLKITLDLEIDPEAKTLNGLAVLNVGPTVSGFGVVELDFDEVQVESVTFSESDVSWSHDDGKLLVSGIKDQGDIEVKYKARPRRGLYFVGPCEAHPDRRHQAWSQCQDADGHFFFPCIDHPSCKVSMTIHVTAPGKFTVVSNGERAGVESLESGWKRWSWEQEQPIPAYLVTVVVEELEIVEDIFCELPLRYLVPIGTGEEWTRRVFGRTPQMIDCFEQQFGVSYPWPRYDQVIVDDFIFGGMENVAATTLTRMTLTGERAQHEWVSDVLIAHELAHQWFGDLVTCRDWSQGWLNEGWATYSEAIWANYIDGREEAIYSMWETANDFFVESDTRYSRAIVTYMFREPIDMFDRHLYEKAGCVVHTLRNELGDDAFWPAVTSYLNEFAHQTVHTYDFQSSLERSTGRNLDWFFNQWIHSPGFPELGIKLSENNGSLEVTVTQTQSGKGVPSAYRFELELHLAGAETTSVTLSVRERSRTFVVPVPEGLSYIAVDPGFSFLSRMKIDAPAKWHIAAMSDHQLESPTVRIRAGEALARQNRPDGTLAIGTALAGEPHWGVRKAHYTSLARTRSEQSMGILLSALETEKEPRARLALVRGLGQFRDERVWSALLPMAVDGDLSLYAEAEAGAILGRHRAPKAIEAAEALLSKDSWAEALRCGGVRCLGAMRDPIHLDRIVDFSTAKFPQGLRSVAAGALGQLAHEVPECRLLAVERLNELAESGPFRVKLAAVSAIGRVRDPSSIGVLQRLHQSAADGRTMRMAWEALVKVRAGRGSDDALANVSGSVDQLEKRYRDLKGRLDRLD